MMRTGIVMAFVFGLTFGAEAANGQETLQGTWTLIAGEANGEALSEEQLQGGKLVIDGDRYSVTLKGMGTTTGVQVLASTQNPRTIDITDSIGPHKGRTCLGIYEIEGDVFRVAFAQPGKPRPSNFYPARDSGSWVHTWKRVTE